MRRGTANAWLGAIVIAHFVVTILHGNAHSGAHVGLGRAGNLFVILVIVIAPIAGWLIAWRAPRTGAVVVATSMAGALVFGLVNHFLVISPDHVSQVAPEWRTLFSTTAVLLVVTEAAGIAAGVAALLRLRTALTSLEREDVGAGARRL